MIYNSNGNNAPYQTGGNAKVNKQLKALEEAINNVSGALTNYETSNDSAVQALQNNVTDLQNTSVSDGRRIDALELTVGDLPVKVQTIDVKAEKGDFHTILNGKYLFQNGYQTASNAYICRLTKGSVVWATDGTNGILVDYTDSDAWVAKAHVAENKKFTISENGVLIFSEASSFSVYVIGNVFDTTIEAEGDETDILTGITIGGTLYAALARDYDFNNVNIDNLTINNKLELTDNATFTSTTATIDDLHTDHITSGDIIVDDASVKNLVAAKRNIKDGLNSSIIIDAHPTTDKVFIGVSKFTGVYSLRLDKVINNVNQTLFTATIVWNGNNPIVNYWENQSIATRDYLYSITLTDDALYFCTQGDGTLYYAYDAMSDASAPMTFPSMPELPNDIICEYITAYEERTVFLGNHTATSGVDVLGELAPDIFKLPDDFSIDDLTVYSTLTVEGTTSLSDTNINGDLTSTGNGTFDGTVDADKLVGHELKVRTTETVIDPDTQEETTVEHKHLEVNANGATVNVDVAVNGDVEHTGDLTQTGNQTVTGEVVISEKETINNIEPDTPGYYKKYDYWEDSEGNKIDQNLDAVENIIGTEKSRTAIIIQNTMADRIINYGQMPLPRKLVCYEKIPRYFFFIDNNVFEVIDGHPVQTSKTRSDFTDNCVWVGASPNPGSGEQLVITDNSESILEKNAVYLYRYGYVARILGGNSSIPVNDPVIKAEVTNRQKTDCLIEDTEEVKYYKFALTQNGYEHVEEIDPHTYGLCPKGGSTYWNDTSWVSRTFYYTPHQEFIAEPDPDATYDDNNEVLTVKGNERITRDLKVQGNIFGDDYHTAFLPNVTSTETNTENLTANVVTIGDLD